MRRVLVLLVAAGIGVVFTIVWLLSRPPGFPEANTIMVLPGPARVITWTEDSSRIVLGYADGILKIWDLSHGPSEIVSIPYWYNSSVTGASISPSQKYLAAGFGDNTVMIWDLASNKLHYESQPLRYGVNHIAWTSDSRLVAFSNSEVISVVDVEAAAEVQKLEGAAANIYWIPDSYLLTGKPVSGRGGISVWDRETGNEVTHLNTLSGPGLLSPDGRRILSSGVWDIATEQQITRCLNCFVATASFAWSPDSQQVAIGSGRYMCFEGSFYCVEDFNIRVWHVETDTTPMVLSGHEDNVITLAWSADGSKITSISMDDTARIWDAHTYTLLQTLSIGEILIYGQVILSPDGRMAAINDSTSVRIVDLDTAHYE